MSTVTASQLASGAKAVHTGVQVVGGVVSLSVTATAASVFLLAKVPNGATIVGWTFYGDDNAANQVIDIGTSASPSALGSFSLSTSAHHSSNQHLNLVPARVSLSDDPGDASVWIQAKNAVAVSASADFRFQLFYTMDGLKGNVKIR